MGLFNKTAIAMEISNNGIGCVLVNRKKDKHVLERATWHPLPDGTIGHNMRQLQVEAPDAFIETVRAAWGDLHCSQSTLSVSLPDSAGFLLLETLEIPWKRKKDALDVLRWKLAKRFGFDPAELHLDFQVLVRYENGGSDLLVALAHCEVIQQYEALLREAGLQPAQISFNSLNLLQLADYCLPTDEGLIVLFYDNNLTVVVLAGGQPKFYRMKAINITSENTVVLRRELVGSLAACRHLSSSIASNDTFCYVEPENAEIVAIITELIGDKPVILNPKETIAVDCLLPFDAWQFHRLSAAIGASVGVT